MPFRRVLIIAALLLPAFLNAEPAALHERVQNALQLRNEAAFLELYSPEPELRDPAKQFFAEILTFNYQKATVTLARAEAEKSLLHVFLQGTQEARFQSWVVVTTPDSALRSCEIINTVGGLFRLGMNPGYLPVRDVVFKHFDATFHLSNGNLFLIEAGGEVTGVVFLGSGRFEFAPPAGEEQQQVKLFVKQTRLDTTMESLYVRGSPETLNHLFGDLFGSPLMTDPVLYARAQDTAKSFDRNVYSVKLPFTDELWFTRLKENEIYCEIQSAAGDLIYQHSPSETDDLLLALKDKDQVISLYSSDGNRLSIQGAEDFELLSYDMRLNFVPTSNYLSAVTSVRIKSNKEASTIPFRLNPVLRVSQIQSRQGSLIYFQEKKTNNLHVILNEGMREGDEIVLDFYYRGKIPPERTKSEVAMVAAQMEEDFYLPPTFLYSNQSLWYPQLLSRPYATGSISITVPTSYAAITNGRRLSIDEQKDSVTFAYNCDQPAKYFSLFVGRLDAHMTRDSIVPIDIWYLSLDRNAAEEYGKSADKILRFYSNYFGAYPYPGLTLVLRPLYDPGGHAPASVAIVNRVFRFFQKKTGRDPLYIPDFPDFLLAHEIAHQWWGQAVGWESYRDQWLSEGFAQFAAWEYIRSEHGQAAWNELARIFYGWIEEKTYAGPLILGARLGHITEDPQAFSALLYNKGAYTLAMLKNWMGEENFAKCLAEFYSTQRFKRATVDEFTKMAQRYSAEDLTPFFRQWLYGWEIPAVQWSQETEKQTVHLKFQQTDKGFYRLKIPVEAKSGKGEVFRTVVTLNEPLEEIAVAMPFVPASVSLDPLHETLMKTTETRQ